MTFDCKLFADKLVRCRDQLGYDTATLSSATGFTPERLQLLLDGGTAPSGDEVLILADVFKLDFQFFVSGDAQTPVEQMDVLYRRFGDRVGPEDRRAIAELLYLCDTEQFLQTELGRTPAAPFAFKPAGNYFKKHGQDAAAALRAHLRVDDRTAIGDVFAIARRLGIHVFRRRLSNDEISGLTIRHPFAGPCVLVNADDDPYRQRFTLAHEVGHVFLDQEEDVVVSFSRWEKDDLVEVRANEFASCFLVPRAVLQGLVGRGIDDQAFVQLAHRLEVNAETLARSLAAVRTIDSATKARLRRMVLPRAEKKDPELSATLTQRQRERKVDMLERGLSQAYVELCLEAYDAGIISRGRLAEALLIGEDELRDVVALYGRRLADA